jgi:predicted DNA-binding protein
MRPSSTPSARDESTCTCDRMCTSFDRRLQLLLAEERYRRVASVAQQRGVSVAAVTREAIERGLRSPDDRRAAAAGRILDAPPMPVPELPELLEELDALRGRRA